MLEGRFGFLQAFCGDRSTSPRSLDGLGERWELPGIFFKPYPCNHFTHAGIDAALRAARRAASTRRHRGRSSSACPSAVLRTIARAAPRRRPARDPATTRRSAGPYTVAAALLGGGGLGVFHEDFTDEAAADDAGWRSPPRSAASPTHALRRDLPAPVPRGAARTATDGGELEERVDANRGGPGNPLSADELATKFRLNAARVLTEEAAQDVSALAFDLPRSSGVRALMEKVAGPGRP